MVAGLALTALWSLAVAGIGSGDVAALVTEAVRDLAWLSVTALLARRGLWGVVTLHRDVRLLPTGYRLRR